MSVLITGGAGYVGGTVVDHLIDRGESIVVVDNLSRSPDSGLPDGIPFYRADIGNREVIADIVRDHSIHACLHFAGLIAVGESVEQPGLYFEQNVSQTIELLDTLATHGVREVVFSSSAAVYGEPEQIPIPEDHPHRPTSPYGSTKSIVEQILTQYDLSGMMRSVSLRYFNAAGASPGRSERHIPETHLVPLAIDAALALRDPLTVFGTDYDTPDGTAVRDYIHVIDLADAHLRALDYLRSDGTSEVFNLGNGEGYSVMQVIESVSRVANREVPFTLGPRRAGDPPVLVASADRAQRLLGWVPQHPELDTIVSSAWASRTPA
ncbi:MAG: UDP-glucose 4-epimerase GalE [Actinomycetota bacterium]|nr:UDP-glucose 4-epimerase GalE [Actinomycetota bacterium]